MDVEGNTVDLAKRNVELEVQCEQLKEEKKELEQGVMEAKAREAKMKEKYSNVKGTLDSEKSKWREEAAKIREKYWNAELKKRALEIDLAITRRKKDPRVTDDQMSAKKLKLEERKNLELNQKIEALEKGKEQLIDQVSKLKREKGEELMKFISEKVAAQAQNRAFEEECTKKISELRKKIDALEVVKRELEARLSQAHLEKKEEVDRILKEKMDLKEQQEKMIKILNQKIETLEAQKKKLDGQKSVLELKSDENVELGTPHHHIITQGNITSEEKTAFTSGCKRKQPLGRKLTGGSTSVFKSREPLPRSLTGDSAMEHREPLPWSLTGHSGMESREPLRICLTGGSAPSKRTRSGIVYGMD